MRRQTEYVPLPGSTKRNLPKGIASNEAPTGEFTVRVMVRPRPQAKAAAAITAASDAIKPHVNDRKYLTRDEFEKQFGADPDEMKQVEDFAAANGLRVVSSKAAQRTVVLSGTAAQFAEAFRVQLVRCFVKGRAYRCRTGAVQIPKELQVIVTSVIGLDNRPFAHPQYRISRGPAKSNPAAVAMPAPQFAPQFAKVGGIAGAGAAAAAALAHANAFPTGFTPPQIAGLYNFPKATDGTGQTIAIVELGGGFRPSELTTYFGQIGVTTPRVTVASYDNGGSNNPGTDPFDETNPDVEVMLDIQVAGSVAPGANMVVYFAPDASDASFLGVMTAIIHDTVNNPNIVSISWGGSEQGGTQQFLAEFNSLLQSATQLGITVCVASGDDGSADFASEDPNWDGNTHVDYPASDPFALACGGTQITAADGKIKDEVTWNVGTNIGSGGGVSRFFNLPDYQQAAGVPPSASPAGSVMRGVPDVAGNAAQESGYRILCDGQQFPDEAQQVPPVGGTSAVAPLWAGLVACMNQSLGKPVGFLNPLLYGIDAKAGAFRDITTGNNGAYSAGAGWDPCTGLGTPDGQKLLTALQGPLAPPAPPVTPPGPAPIVPGPAPGPTPVNPPTSCAPTPEKSAPPNANDQL